MARQGITNGGLLYHEVQESKLCAVHCVNTVLQGPFFSEFDLATIAADLDQRETQMMMEGGLESADYLRFVAEDSSNVAMDGDFSIQVLEKALEIWDLQVIPVESPLAEKAQIDPQLEDAFICHLQNHWFCIRKVDGEWYNFNSLYPAPEHLSRFYLSAYLDTLKSAGWSMFLVRGNFPAECPLPSSETNNGFGQWLTPDDAHKITKTMQSPQNASQRHELAMTMPSLGALGGTASLSGSANYEESQVNAAIIASLGNAPPLAENSRIHDYHPDSFEPMQSGSYEEDEELMAAIVASLKDTASGSGNSSYQSVAQPPAFVASKAMQPVLAEHDSKLMGTVAANLMDSFPSTDTSTNMDVSKDESTTPTMMEDVLLEKQDPTLMENSAASQGIDDNHRASQFAVAVPNLIPANSDDPNVFQLAAAMAASLANVQVPPQRDDKT